MLNLLVLLHIPGASCFWWLLLAMLLPLLLGLLLGYWLWHKYVDRARLAEAERDDYHHRLTALEKDYASLKYENEKLRRESEAAAPVVETQRAVVLEPSGFDFDALFDPGNLQIIEGIGPKVEALLKQAGITNWGELGNSSTEEIREVLAEAGPVYRMQNPTSWPRQAQLAANGKWSELVEYQHFLDAGRETTGDFDNPAKIEVMAERMLDAEGQPVTARGLTGPSYRGLFADDNLKIIEGIGPKIEALLKDAGYANWSALGQAEPDALRETLAAGGSAFKMHDPSSWPRQAQLAASGKWQELIEYQAFLDAGRESGGHEGNPAKVERMAASLTGFTNSSPDDLKIIEGIGPKIEELLKANGVANWHSLALQTTEDLLDILAAGGDAFRMANPRSWPVQARLAVAGDWKALREYQDYLEGGIDPV